jgi:hypothetical protein
MTTGALIALCVVLLANFLGLLLLIRRIETIEFNQLNLMTKNSELAGKLSALSTQLGTAKTQIIAALAAQADPPIAAEAESALTQLQNDVVTVAALVPPVANAS